MVVTVLAQGQAGHVVLAQEVAAVQRALLEGRAPGDIWGGSTSSTGRAARARTALACGTSNDTSNKMTHQTK